MTSIPSRDDVRAELYAAGVTRPFTLSRLMTLIDVYTLHQVRRQHPLEDVPQGPFGYLGPGEWDLDEKVTRCAKCEKVKRTRSMFGVDKAHPTGRKTTCKSCLRVRPAREDERRFKCPGCEQKKVPKAFSEAKQKHPRLREKCLECQAKPPRDLKRDFPP